MLIVTTSARAKVRTPWFHAIDRTLDDSLELSFGESSMLFADPRLNHFMGKSEWHKDGTGPRAFCDVCQAIAAVHNFFDV
jgi:hypothetical protein